MSKQHGGDINACLGIESLHESASTCRHDPGFGFPMACTLRGNLSPLLLYNFSNPWPPRLVI